MAKFHYKTLSILLFQLKDYNKINKESQQDSNLFLKPDRI